MSLKRIMYIDGDGRKKDVYLPEDVPVEEAEYGIPIGPPSLEELGLPKEMEVRLSNELYNRGIITINDALRGRAEIVGAIQAAFKIDAGRIVTLYTGKDFSNVRQEKSEQEVAVARQSQPRSRRRR